MINLTDLQDTFKESFQSSIDEQQINLFNAIMIIFELRKINSEKIKFDYNHGFRVDFKIEELAYDRTISLKFDKGFPILGVLSLVSLMFTKQEELENMIKNNRHLLWEYIYV